MYSFQNEVNWQCKDHSFKECCSYFMQNGIERRLVVIDF